MRSLDDSKNEITRKFKLYEQAIQAYIIARGSSNSIAKFYVVVKEYTYEVDDLFEAVDRCFEACVALHTWSTLCRNIYAFLKHFIYRIPIDISCAFVTKSTQRVAGYCED